MSRDLTDLAGLGPGDHVYWRVEDADDRLLDPFLADGSRHNDKLTFFGPATARFGDGASIDPYVAFLGAGTFDPGVMYETFRREAAAARDEGHRALRLVADMDWLLGPAPDAETVLSFELLLDEVVGETGATVVCAYRTGSFPANDVRALATVHPLRLGDGARPPFRVWSAGDGGWAIAGEVDVSTAGAFRTSIETLAASRRDLRVDIHGLRFIDAAGIRAVTTAARSNPDTSITLIGPTRVFERCWALLDCASAAPTVELRHA